MDPENDIMNYKKNPELFIAKLRSMSANFKKECQNKKVNILSKEAISDMSNDFQVNLDKYIEGDFDQFNTQLQKRVKIQESAKTQEPLRKKYLLGCREELIKELEKANLKSKTAEMKAKNELLTGNINYSVSR